MRPKMKERLLAEHRLAVGDDLNILREQFLEQLTRGLTDKQEMDHRMHTYELHLDSYRMAAFQFVEYSTEHKQRNLTALKNLVASLNPIGYTYFFDDYMVLSLFPAQRNPASLEPILKACLEVCGIVNRFSDTCICAGISLCHEGAASLSLAGDEAVRALSRHFFSEETVSVYQLIPEEPSPKDMAEESFLCGLKTLLNSYDFEPLWPKLQAYFSRQRSGIANADEVIDTCRQIYYICVRVLARNERESLSTELLTAISQSTNLTSLEKAVARILENTQEILRHPSAQASPAVASAVEYIYAHYADSLYLNDIAEYVHLNPHHLCRIFKKERGETINEHITHVRIEKAKRLLREGNLAYEVAEQVGFKDPAYFSLIFKKQTSLSPKNYR